MHNRGPRNITALGIIQYRKYCKVFALNCLTKFEVADRGACEIELDRKRERERERERWRGRDGEGAREREGGRDIQKEK